MSNNPFETPGGAAGHGSMPPTHVKSKVTPIGIALIVAGILSLLGGAYWAFSGGAVMMQGDQIFDQMSEADREKMEEAAAQGIDPQALIGGMGVLFLAGGVAGCISSLIVIWGGICALKLKGRKMAMAAAILSIIPIFQSCCIVSMPIGIWALVVLMAPDVKAAFR